MFILQIVISGRICTVISLKRYSEFIMSNRQIEATTTQGAVLKLISTIDWNVET